MVNLKTYQDYDKFLANMQSEIDRHKPSVPLVASNYADWQPQLKYDVEDSDIKDVLVRYSQEYSVVNHSDRLGSPSDIFSSYYEEGQRPSGFATKIVPQRPEYGNLRGQILALADQIRSMGFEVKDIRVEDRMIHDPNQGYPTHKMILFDVWNEAIEEQRDIMYHLNEPAFRREQAAEQAAERAYEENWHRQNGGPTIPDYDERSLMPDIQEQHTTLAFDKIAMLKDDEGKWALFMKPENEKSLSVYPTKEDVSKYFATVKKGDADASERMRLLMASKYYVMATENPSLKVDLFKSQASPETLAKIDRVNIFKNKESRLLLMPTINGEKLKPREISPGQWQRMWLAEDMQDYKKHLAATVFADVLTEGKDKSLSSESPSPTIQSHSEGKNQSVSSDSPATSPKISPLVKQYLDLKAKHPDAMLLFRTGDFYETYKEDAENASKILGITLTRSSKTKDEQGKPLTMAGFPYHALDSYLPKLIRAGQRIAICDQIEAPHQTAKQGLAETSAPASVMAKQKEVISKAGPLAQEYNLTKTRSGWTIQPPGSDTPIGLARIDAAKLERDPSIFSDLVKNYENPQSRSQHL